MAEFFQTIGNSTFKGSEIRKSFFKQSLIRILISQTVDIAK